MYIEDPHQIYGCFRCGVIQEDIEEDTSGFYKCCSCGEFGITSFVRALDIINDMHLKGVIQTSYEEYENDLISP